MNKDLSEELLQFGYFAMDYGNPNLDMEYFVKNYGIQISKETMPEDAFKMYWNKAGK